MERTCTTGRCILSQSRSLTVTKCHVTISSNFPWVSSCAVCMTVIMLSRASATILFATSCPLKPYGVRELISSDFASDNPVTPLRMWLIYGGIPSFYSASSVVIEVSISENSPWMIARPSYLATVSFFVFSTVPSQYPSEIWCPSPKHPISRDLSSVQTADPALDSGENHWT